MQKSFSRAITLSATLLSALASAQQAVHIESVNQALRLTNAKWKAKENWVSRLSKPEIQRMLGVKELPDMNIEFAVPEKKGPPVSVSGSVDWRNKDGVNWVSPIRNQGNCGSCVAFAAAGVFETQMNISANFAQFMPKVSTQALFACGGGACDYGWQPSEASAYLASDGVPDEACLPYTSGASGSDVECSAACADRASRSVKTVSSKQATNGVRSIDSVKRALAHGPLMTTLTVYSDFLTYSSGVYKHVTGEALGGHAVSIVGYSDSDRAWIVRNSWGKDWGDNGYVKVSYDDRSGIAASTWGFDLPAQDGYISIQTPSDREVLSGVANLNIESTISQSSAVNLTILDAQGKVVRQTLSQGLPNSLQLDTTTLKDGDYELFATTQASKSQISSQHVKFSVLNGTATGSLSFKPQGFDMKQTLTERVVFDVAAPSTPIAFSGLTLHIKQGAKEVLTKSIDTVLPAMTMGWRTQTVPNGNYEIYFSAYILSGGKTVLSAESEHASVSVRN